MMIHPLALGMPGFPELVVIALIGLLFFGKRLPEVGRSVGKTIVEFKKGMKEVEEEINSPAAAPPAAAPPVTSAPQISSTGSQPYKFDPYTGKPIGSESTTTSQT